MTTNETHSEPGTDDQAESSTEPTLDPYEALAAPRKALLDTLLDTIIQQNVRSELRYRQAPLNPDILDDARAKRHDEVDDDGEETFHFTDTISEADTVTPVNAALRSPTQPLHGRPTRPPSPAEDVEDTYTVSVETLTDTEEEVRAMFSNIYDHALRLLVGTSIVVSANAQDETVYYKVPSYLFGYTLQDDPAGYTSKDTTKKRALMEVLSGLGEEMSKHLVRWTALSLAKRPYLPEGGVSTYYMPAGVISNNLCDEIQKAIIKTGARDRFIETWMQREQPLGELNDMEPESHSIRPIAWMPSTIRPSVVGSGSERQSRPRSRSRSRSRSRTRSAAGSEFRSRSQTYSCSISDSVLSTKGSSSSSSEREDKTDGARLVRRRKRPRTFRRINKYLDSMTTDDAMTRQRTRPLMKYEVHYEFTLAGLVEHAEQNRKLSMAEFRGNETRTPTVALSDIILPGAHQEAARKRNEALSEEETVKRLEEPFDVRGFLAERGITKDEDVQSILYTPLRDCFTPYKGYCQLPWEGQHYLGTSNCSVDKTFTVAKFLTKEYKLANQAKAEKYSSHRSRDGWTLLDVSYGVYPSRYAIELSDVGIDTTLEKRLNLPMPRSRSVGPER